VQVRDTPSAEFLAELYGDSYFDRGKYTEDLAQLREQERRLQLLRDAGLPQGAKVLDAGCATGGFVKCAKSHFDMWGVDISSFAVEEARETNPEVADQLFAGLLEDLNFEPHSFDAIVLWDVVEHLTFPKGTITELARLLKPGGLLYLSTPNVGAMTARLMGRRWAFMTPPEHMCLFDRKTLSRLLSDAGCSPQFWMTRGKWVNTGFFLYKLRKVFPALLPAAFVKWVQNSKFGAKLFYVPTGDIQYLGAIYDSPAVSKAMVA
jgi:SAM-dependent methyltransferase